MLLSLFLANFLFALPQNRGVSNMYGIEAGELNVHIGDPPFRRGPFEISKDDLAAFERVCESTCPTRCPYYAEHCIQESNRENFVARA
jgi:hypothetical protein